jgi:hypothetical protein
VRSGLRPYGLGGRRATHRDHRRGRVGPSAVAGTTPVAHPGDMLRRPLATLVSTLTPALVAGLIVLPMEPAGAVVVGPNGQIAFQSDRDGDFEIWVANPEASAPDLYAAPTEVFVSNADGSASEPVYLTGGRHVPLHAGLVARRFRPGSGATTPRPSRRASRSRSSTSRPGWPRRSPPPALTISTPDGARTQRSSRACWRRHRRLRLPTSTSPRPTTDTPPRR